MVSKRRAKTGCPQQGQPVSKLLLRLLATCLPLGTPLAYALDPNALPSGGVVSVGSASISSSGSALNIHQTSHKAALNWQQFDIGSQARVNFIQPNSQAVALNRISGSTPTQIYGQLNANGQVFLLNPNGILFGQHSQVNVGGILASTMRLHDADFLAANYRLTDPGLGSVLNQGLINASGSVNLVANDLNNTGSVFATTVSLVSGNTVALNVTGDGLIRARVTDAALKTSIHNSGELQAAQVTLSAGEAKGALDRVVNNSGVIRATGIKVLGGEVLLEAGNVSNTGTIVAQNEDGCGGNIKLMGDMTDGQTWVGGRIDASSTTSQGGHIEVIGTTVAIEDGAHLTASGATGGGEVLVGGSWQNTDPTVRQAVTTTIAPTAKLKANATDQGNGGTVVAWSDITNPASITRAHGRFEAKGGPNGGDGGRIETSGHWLDTAGIAVATKGLSGKPGMWLLDPYTVTIGVGSTSGTAFPSSAPFSFTPSATSVILASAITTALQNGNNVTVATGDGSSQSDGGDIKVTASITPTLNAGDVTLRLNASRRILVDSVSISATGANKLHLHLNPNRNAAEDGGDVVIDWYSILKTNGGEFKALGGANFDSYLRGYNGLAMTSTDTVYGTTGFYMTNAALVTAGGNITIKVKSGTYSGSSQTEAFQMYSSCFSSSAGNITLWGEANTPSSTGIVRGVNLWGNGNDGVDTSTRLSLYTLEATTGSIAVTGIAKLGANNAYGDGVYFTRGGDSGAKIYTASGSLTIYGQTNYASSRGVSTGFSNDALIATNTGNISIVSNNTAAESWKGGLVLDSVESTSGTITASTNGSIVLYDPITSGASGTAIALHGKGLTTDSGSSASITTSNGRWIFFGETGATVHSSFTYDSATPTNCGYGGSTTTCASGTDIPVTGNRLFLTGASNVTFANPNNLTVPTVSGLSNQTKTFGDAAYTLAATVTDGAGTISYASSNTAVATVNSSTGAVTIIGAGSATITANVVANASYSTTSGSYALTVGKGTPTVSAGSALSKTYGNAAYTQAATVTDGAGTISYASNNTAVATVNSSTGAVTIIGAGSATITASAASNTNYDAASGNYALTVGKATPTVTAGADASKTYGDAAYTQAASVTDGAGTISYASSNTAVATVDSSTGAVTIIGAGSATITASAASNTNYDAASGNYALTVAHAMLAVSAGADAAAAAQAAALAASQAAALAASQAAALAAAQAAAQAAAADALAFSTNVLASMLVSSTSAMGLIVSDASETATATAEAATMAVHQAQVSGSSEALTTALIKVSLATTAGDAAVAVSDTATATAMTNTTAVAAKAANKSLTAATAGASAATTASTKAAITSSKAAVTKAENAAESAEAASKVANLAVEAAMKMGTSEAVAQATTLVKAAAEAAKSATQLATAAEDATDLAVMQIAEAATETLVVKTAAQVVTTAVTNSIKVALPVTAGYTPMEASFTPAVMLMYTPAVFDVATGTLTTKASFAPVGSTKTFTPLATAFEPMAPTSAVTAPAVMETKITASTDSASYATNSKPAELAEAKLAPAEDKSAAPVATANSEDSAKPDESKANKEEDKKAEDKKKTAEEAPVAVMVNNTADLAQQTLKENPIKVEQPKARTLQCI